MKSFITSFAAIAFCTAALLSPPSALSGEAKQCPDFLNHEYRQLHNTKLINLCDFYTGMPILFVNTASHCGFTRQFGPLEQLHTKYKDQGLTIIGFASDDFRQAAKDEAEAASVCYKNYGVTFTMLAPTSVKGKDANPTFSYLADKSRSPSWNFNKYLVAGDKVAHLSSRDKPLGSKLEEAISKGLEKVKEDRAKEGRKTNISSAN